MKECAFGLQARTGGGGAFSDEVDLLQLHIRMDVIISYLTKDYHYHFIMK